MGIQILRATGKAHCFSCKEIIAKDEVAVKFTGYRISEQYHYQCVQQKVRDYLTNERVRVMKDAK